MHILALQLGHNASALLACDRQIAGVVAQEKFDNIKNSAAFPAQAIDWLLAQAGLTAAQLDRVAICGRNVYPRQMDDLSVPYGRPGGPAALPGRLADWLEYRWPHTPPERLAVWLRLKQSELRAMRGRRRLRTLLHQLYGLPAERLVHVAHHVCHAHAPLTFFGDDGGDWLVLTLDGAGDVNCASVNLWRDGAMTRLASTPWAHSLGYAYARTTAWLGLRQLQDEHKVMGLAGYAAPEHYGPTYERLFHGVAGLRDDRPLEFTSAFSLKRFDHHLRARAAGERFDNVAGALQHFLEQHALDWVRRAVRQTGVGRLMLAGGVFMNVKLVKAIQELDEVAALRVMPSAGDETNPFGAAFVAARDAGETIDAAAEPTVYLGPAYDAAAVERFVATHGLAQRFAITKPPDIEDALAALLARNQVVARVRGRAEFGARSLGNRAILANPSELAVVHQVNARIKRRDFWMPFAPTLLAEAASGYLVNPKGYAAPYMATSFDTTAQGRAHLAAAMHPADGTVRPQILTATANPDYHRLVSAFRARTGIGGVLNTSLNLHGRPLAATLEQALYTFENAALQHMALGELLVSKPTTEAREKRRQ